MRKRLYKSALVAATSILALTGLASCGGSNVENAGEQFELLGLEALKGEEPTVVEFWHSFGDAIETELVTLIENFETEMTEAGYNIDINLTNKGGGYDGLRAAVNLGTGSNTLPTMILGYPDHFADYISNDILLPLDDFVYASDSSIALDGVTTTSNDFISSYWAETQMVMNNKTITAAIPFNKSTEIMVYNASMVDPILKELNIGEAKGEDWVWTQPTWEEVFQVSEYIQNAYKAGNLSYTTKTGATEKVQNMEYPVYVDSEANFFITTSRQWGGEGKYTVLNEDGSGTVVAYNETNKEAQAYFMANAGIGANSKALFQFPAKVHQNYGSNLLTASRAFISIGSTAGIRNNNSNNYELKATGIPQRSYDEAATQAVIQQGTNVAILSKNSNNKTRLAAWMLIKYLTNTENTEFFSKKTGYLPVRESALNSTTFQAMLADEDSIYTGTVAKAINAAFTQKDYFYTDPAFIGSSVVRDKAAVMINDMYSLEKTYDYAMGAYYDALKTFRISTR